tara:strand:+ start:1110134 stop:1110808 length:675 start_codon:yes stop_codon:yes gene_type:complete
MVGPNPGGGDGGNPTQPVVFIVEDDDDYRSALCVIVSAAGYHVNAFGCPQKFIDAYQPSQPGCLVLDFQTPGFEVVDLYQALVEKGGSHPFIVISAHGNVPKVAHVMRHGAIDFLAKPVDHRQLIQRIGEAIAKDAARRSELDEQRVIRDRLGLLTKRESEVLPLVVQGLASKQIGKQLDMGTNTVDVHRSNILKKLNVASSVELVRVLSTHSLLPVASGGDAT